MSSAPVATQVSERLTLAFRYRQLGWALTRVASWAKAPIDAAWQHASPPTAEDLQEWFGTNKFNLGLRLGTVSGGLAEIDVDDERLRPFLSATAPQWANQCPVWARDGRPHILFRCTGAVTYRKIVIGSKCVGELRGDGRQSLVPPSLHPTGATYVWVRGPHEPPMVSAEDAENWLLDAATTLALSFAWQAGNRHDLALAFGGWFARKGVPEERAIAMIRATAHHTQDDEVRDREEAVSDSYSRVRDGQPATGWPTLKRQLGSESVDLLRSAWPAHAAHDEERVGSFVAKGYRAYYRRGEGEDVELANFDARILRELRRDDGSGDVQRTLEIGGTGPNGDLPTISISSEEFAGMGWVIREFGSSAVVAAGYGNRDRLREAIQRLSGIPALTTMYTHTGWRRIDGRWRYLHGGLADGVQVDLSGSLRRYALPPDPASPAVSVKASLSLLNLGARRVTVPLWCAMYLAPLASLLEPDLTLWLWGPTGAFKSTVAALFLNHYGDFDRKTLPADWSSTDNALERQAYLAKDVPLVSDEFAPPPGRSEHQRLVTKASRLLRAQGNLSGRARMRADTSLRDGMHPRGLIISTAEMPPPLPASAIARSLIVEVPKGAIDPTLLAAAQASRADLGPAMAAYVAWLAGHYVELEADLPALFTKTRARYQELGHRRIPEALAHLESGALVAMRAFVDLGVLSADEGRSLMEAIRGSLLALGESQSAQLREANPAKKFLTVLAELFAKKNVYCVGRHGDQPPDCAEVGWQARDILNSTDELVPRPGADRIGWADEDWLYLMPEDAPRLVSRFLGDTDQSLGASTQSLFRALEDRGCIEVHKNADGARRTVSVLLEGSQRRVLKLRRDALEGV